MRKDRTFAAGIVLALQASAWGVPQSATFEDRVSGLALGDLTGRSVAVDDGWLVVGSPRSDLAGSDAGAVSVYRFDGQAWFLNMTLTASNPTPLDLFGFSVDIDNSFGIPRLIVGAPGYDGNLSIDPGPDCALTDTNKDGASGAAYVYRRLGATWVEEGFLTALDNERLDQFGWSVAMDGMRAVVGAPFDDDACPAGASKPQCDSGSAYAFLREGGAWSFEAKLVASDEARFDSFGLSVDVSGDVILVGAPKADTPSYDSGAAYVFERAGSSWVELGKLLAADGGKLDRFGEVVAMEGDTLVIGAPFAESNATAPGAAYVFEAESSAWLEVAKLRSNDGADLDRFGEFVDIAAGRIAVGARWSRSRGAAYLFANDGTLWSQAARVEAFDGEEFDQFGYSIGLDASVLAVGSFCDDDKRGSAYLYRLADPVFVPFCHGDGGDQFGCTACPCGNNAASATLGGCLNPEGKSAHLIPDGVPSVTADTLKFTATGASSLSFGFLNSGANRLPNGPAHPCFGLASGLASPLLDGLRCVGGGLLRHGSRASNANGEIGVTGTPWGPPAGPVGGLLLQVGYAPGQTRHFQLFYRQDDLALCGTGQNTSEGVSVLLLP